jgi:SAM-dependent methyltransferase
MKVVSSDYNPSTGSLLPSTRSGSTFWREQWRQLKLAHFAVPNYGNSQQFWGSKKMVHAVYLKDHKKRDETVENRLNVMNIPEGLRVLDIGAGPGTYAIPLAQKGCSVTVVEPSPVMREALEKRLSEEGIHTIRIIPKRWEDVSIVELEKPFDVIIASYSLTMTDMGEALEKMHACCNGTVHLFWFLTSPAWVQVNMDLWHHLHGGNFPGEPTADWLWQILYEMGIYANLSVEMKFPAPVYLTVDDAVNEFRQRLNCTSPVHEETIRNYFQSILRQEERGLVLGRETLGAHIWWTNTHPRDS